MAALWNHPELGKFKYLGFGWVNFVTVPAFKSFSYDTGCGNTRRSRGQYELAFEADNEEDVPSPAAVALVKKILTNQVDLVQKVIAAIWDDFNGRGPGSDNWWYGELDKVAESIDAEGPLLNADALLEVMQLTFITIYKEAPGRECTMAELNFNAVFEPEHGVGVLTDGENILGIGYCSDVTTFERYQKDLPEAHGSDE